jgi:hypothetical protein
MTLVSVGETQFGLKCSTKYEVVGIIKLCVKRIMHPVLLNCISAIWVRISSVGPWGDVKMPPPPAKLASKLA